MQKAAYASALAVVIVCCVMLTAGIVCADPAQTQTASALGNDEIGKTETAIGDLAADSVRAEMRADVAFIAASEIKRKDPPLPPGTVDSSQIASLITYPDDCLAVLTLNGKQIRDALERSVSIYPQRNLGFLQVSGLKFTFDPNARRGERVKSVRIGNADVNDGKSYTVAVTSSMADGALGYWKVWSKDDVKTRDKNLTIATSIESFFKSNKRIDYSKLDRITASK